MLCPIAAVDRRPPLAGVRRARGQFLHRDAVLYRAEVGAEVAGQAFGIDHVEHAVGFHGDGLVAGVLAGGLPGPQSCPSGWSCDTVRQVWAALRSMPRPSDRP